MSDVAFSIQFRINKRGVPISSPHVLWDGKDVDEHRAYREKDLLSMAMSGADTLSLGQDNWHYAKYSDHVFPSDDNLIRQICYRFERGNGVKSKDEDRGEKR